MCGAGGGGGAGAPHPNGASPMSVAATASGTAGIHLLGRGLMRPILALLTIATSRLGL
jgi:hypothetical protein